MHFDLKSANILLARDWTAKLADVGLAKVLTRKFLTSLHGAVGTFLYAAPEVCLSTLEGHRHVKLLHDNTTFCD